MKAMSLAGMALAILIVADPAVAQKAVPSVELSDPAGDTIDMNGPENMRDVVKLSLGSDGTHVLVGATLDADERGTQAGSVVMLYLDTDNSPRTGGKVTAYWPHAGFEYLGELRVCVSYDGASLGACAGGLEGNAVKSRHARLSLERFKGAPGQAMDRFSRTLENVYSGVGEKAENPVQGRVLPIKIPYADVGLKPGQVVRILARETGQPNLVSFFPEVSLALK